MTSDAPVGQTVHTRTHAVTTLAADGARSEATVVGNGDGSTRSTAPTQTSADGRAVAGNHVDSGTGKVGGAH